MAQEASQLDCRFCLDNQLLVDTPLFANSAFYVLGTIDPTTPGAAIVVGRRHCVSPFEISSAEWAHFPEALAFAHDYCVKSGPDGYTVGWNVGAIAGQEVFHAHLHVIPRFKGSPHDGRGIHAAVRSRPPAGNQFD